MKFKSMAAILGGVAMGFLGLASQVGADETATEIGTAIEIKHHVTGTLQDNKRDLQQNVRVFRNELLETSDKASAEFKLDDDTKLALGPGAELLLDEYVVGGADGETKVSLSLVKGAFRFMTGKNKSESYKIQTPSATIGVRGTVFDVYVSEKGEAAVLLHEGEVEVCSRRRSCRKHKKRGHIVHASLAGVVHAPRKWAGKMLPGIKVKRAFPFVGKRLKIDPVRRLRHSSLINHAVRKPARKAGRAVAKTGRKAGRTVRKTGRQIKRSTRKVRRAIRRANPFK
ncbi:MAG: FecR domain-containing protein [Pseudomonadota bacterium]